MNQKNETKKSFPFLATVLFLILLISACAHQPGAQSVQLEKKTVKTGSGKLSAQSKKAQFKVNYSIENQWQHGFVAQVTVINQSGQDLNGWTVEWNFALDSQLVKQGWNARFTQSGKKVTVKNGDHNGNVPANGTFSFGFNGVYKTSNPIPTDITVNGSDNDPQANLKVLANQKNINIGAAVMPEYFNQSDYTDALSNHFNGIVAENHMKFSYLQPNENQFTFSKPDQIVNLAEKNQMKIRGHALIWHSDYQIPQWVKDKSYPELTEVVKNHTTQVLSHFNNKIYAWDVANEIVIDNGSGLRNRSASGKDYSIWAASATDDSLIRTAFFQADQVRKANHDPVKLFLCDYSIEEKGHAKADKTFNLVKQWVKAGVPIDGIAFQGHLMEEYTPNYAAIKANIDRYQALGLEVQFTEVDIRIRKPITNAKLDHQADIYGQLMSLCLEKGINTFFLWGVTDKYTWVPHTFPDYDAPLLLDKNYQKKPAYHALVNALK